jgi:hypothetical protein
VSWGYHGDDGGIFLNNANSDSRFYNKDDPSEHFGVKGEFRANDTAGVGLDLKTGKGFITLNGEMRDVGKCLFVLVCTSFAIVTTADMLKLIRKHV